MGMHATAAIDVIESFIAGRGAPAIYPLITNSFMGGVSQVVRQWLLGGRLIALRNDGDTPTDRRIRPVAVAVGSVVSRVVSKCASTASAAKFHELL